MRTGSQSAFFFGAGKREDSFFRRHTRKRVVRDQKISIYVEMVRQFRQVRGGADEHARLNHAADNPALLTVRPGFAAAAFADEVNHPVRGNAEAHAVHRLDRFLDSLEPPGLHRKNGLSGF